MGQPQAHSATTVPRRQLGGGSLILSPAPSPDVQPSPLTIQSLSGPLSTLFRPVQPLVPWLS